MEPDETLDFKRREQCPACLGPFRVLYDKGWDEPPVAGFLAWRYPIDRPLPRDMHYTIGECERCALLFQVDIGGPQLLERLYTCWVDDPDGPWEYPTYTRDRAHPIESRDAHEIIAIAAHLRRSTVGLRTLDYGMGWGLWATIARTLSCDSWGTDIAQSRRDFALECGIKLADETNLAPESFDVINTEQVFEHLGEPLAVAQDLARALAPGGLLKISVPSAEPLDPKRIDQLLARKDTNGIMAVHPLEHINGFRKRSMAVLAEQLGLRIERPTIATRYAFLRRRGAIRIANWRHSAKELARPLVQFRTPSNLYCWLRKPG